MRIRLTLTLAVAVVAALAGTALGHHGWSGYDASKEMTLTGSILEAGYEHPDGYVKLDAAARCGESSWRRRRAWRTEVCPRHAQGGDDRHRGGLSKPHGPGGAQGRAHHDQQQDHGAPLIHPNCRTGVAGLARDLRARGSDAPVGVALSCGGGRSHSRLRDRDRAAFFFDLRLLGLARSVPVTALASHLLTWARAGFAVVVPTGLMMFTAHATEMASEPGLRHQARPDRRGRAERGGLSSMAVQVGPRLGRSSQHTAVGENRRRGFPPMLVGRDHVRSLARLLLDSRRANHTRRTGPVVVRLPSSSSDHAGWLRLICMGAGDWAGPFTERPRAVTKRASLPAAWGEKKETTSRS